jgi:formylglycine-generating enzyme required for sulfatase activity
MTEQRPLKVFLCHASADKPAVRKLYRRLLAEEWIDSWLDKEKLSLEQHWTTIIEDALDAADIVLIFLSRNSVHREDFVQRELNYAWDLSLEKPIETIFLIPLRLDDCEVPHHLRSRRWGDYFGDKEENTYQTLLRSLKQRHEQKLQLEAEEQKERDALEKSTNGNAEQSAVKKSAREKEERDTVQKVKQEKSNSDGIKKDARTFNSKKTRMIGIMLVALVLGVLGINFAVNNWPVAALPTPTAQPPTKIAMNTAQSVNAKLTSFPPTATRTPIPLTPTLESPTPTPNLDIGSTLIRSEDGVMMMYVPAGSFKMGIENYESNPINTVYLDAFWIDKTEVTNVMYTKCEQADACEQPHTTTSYSRSYYYGDPQYNYYPVVYVDWNQANAYCAWVNARLPTEAEWEKAARGTDGHKYPWGDAFDGTKANFCDVNCPLHWKEVDYNDGYPDTAPVASFINDLSPYGVFDMLGNVSEWVADWYTYPIKINISAENPQGLESWMNRVLRGGSWADLNWVNLASRSEGKSYELFRAGFRCAISE